MCCFTPHRRNCVNEKVRALATTTHKQKAETHHKPSGPRMFLFLYKERFRQKGNTGEQSSQDFVLEAREARSAHPDQARGDVRADLSGVSSALCCASDLRTARAQ